MAKPSGFHHRPPAPLREEFVVFEPQLFANSMFLGLAIAAPLGPIGALCISRTLERGVAAGLAGGFGTALADAVYAALAALSFAVFSSFVSAIDIPLRLVGGAVMLWLGLKSMMLSLPGTEANVPARDLIGISTATFLITITNPMTILSFATLFAGLGLATDAGSARAAIVVSGVFAGSMLWWCLLSAGVALARHRLPEAFAKWTSRLSGVVLIAYGLWAIGTVVS